MKVAGLRTQACQAEALLRLASEAPSKMVDVVQVRSSHGDSAATDFLAVPSRRDCMHPSYARV